jgi:hypothetical protein
MMHWSPPEVHPTSYGNDFSRERFWRQFEAARAVQRVRYAVAPGQRVPIPGGFLTEASEVTLELLGGHHGYLQALIRTSKVIDADGFGYRAPDPSPEAA